ncbi:hypothetical protein EYF80_024391 [Liparis tanakae]|uniref:Uncharacterized protein n=1 Tax=Liparis tanakae TaxID=230148 RepID=A0A4Z2HJC7_9TELE|nr:hypothetical protein EYF80_024391 [Liparis tanakae]
MAEDMGCHPGDGLAEGGVLADQHVVDALAEGRSVVVDVHQLHGHHGGRAERRSPAVPGLHRDLGVGSDVGAGRQHSQNLGSRGYVLGDSDGIVTPLEDGGVVVHIQHHDALGVAFSYTLARYCVEEKDGALSFTSDTLREISQRQNRPPPSVAWAMSL